MLDAHEDLAHVTDGLRAEREQGITIDVAYRYFATERRSFILADTPGHVRYTRNMVTGASTADLALVLVDARKGLLEQSRRHAYLAALLGIRHLVACVNKMDLVGFEEAKFREIETAFGALGAELGIDDVRAVPISALNGDNVVDRSSQTPWYDGPPLLELLEGVEVARDRNLDDVRFPVQWTVRGEDYRGYAGRVAGGVLRTGDEVAVLPHGSRSRIARLDTPSGPVAEAFPPMVATVVLEDELDVGRGDVLVTPERPPEVARELEATVCWMVEAPARVGARYLLKHTTQRVRANIAAISARVDIDSYAAQPADELGLNDIGRITLRTAAPVFPDAYAENRATGAFILIDERSHDTVAAGMVEVARRGTGRGGRALARHPLASERAGPRQAVGARSARAAPPSGSPGCPPRASRRSPWPSRRRWWRPGASPTCSTATTSATGCPATSASIPPPAARTSAASRTSRGCSPTRARSRWCRSCPRSARTGTRRASCTRRPGCRSSRCSWTRRSRNARAATPRACTRGPGRDGCRG